MTRFMSNGGVSRRGVLKGATAIGAAVAAAERFYPAFQLVAWGGQSPEEAMNIAIAEAYGRA